MRGGLEHIRSMVCQPSGGGICASVHALVLGSPVLGPTCLDTTVGPRPGGNGQGRELRGAEWPCGDRGWAWGFSGGLGLRESVSWWPVAFGAAFGTP